MRNFRKLKIWQKGIELVKEVYKIASELPKEENYGLRSQITRAVISVPSNIAEGCSRNSDVEYKRYLEIAIGSLFELETQIIILQELKMISSDKLNFILEMISIKEKMINSLITKLKANS